MEENQIDVAPPAGTRPPEWALKDLRKIDDDLDLHYLGRGKWVAGAVRQNRIRARLSRRKIEKYHEHGVDDARKVHLACLTMRGLAPIATTDVEPGYRDFYLADLVDDVRLRDWRYRNEPEREFEDSLNVSTQGHHQSKTQLETDVDDAIRQEYPFLFRGKTHPYIGV